MHFKDIWRRPGIFFILFLAFSLLIFTEKSQCLNFVRIWEQNPRAFSITLFFNGKESEFRGNYSKKKEGFEASSSWNSNLKKNHLFPRELQLINRLFQRNCLFGCLQCFSRITSSTVCNAASHVECFITREKLLNRCINLVTPPSYCPIRSSRNSLLSTPPSSLENSEDSSSSDIQRVRFAPSPSGRLHVGGARTAIFNWLVARNSRKKQSFILRIDDSNPEKLQEKSVESILEDLQWLGIDWDEGPDKGGPYGPYRQSERFSKYREAADQLIDKGFVYPEFTRFSQVSDVDKKGGIACNEELASALPASHWREAKPLEIWQAIEAAKERGEKFALRFKVNTELVTTPTHDAIGKSSANEEASSEYYSINDILRGRITWRFPQDEDESRSAAFLRDFIIFRENGLPVYNFCVAVDDAAMKISHVIRGEEHLANTARQLMILKALGFKPPLYAHCSLILESETRQKVSKRRGNVFTIEELREDGFFPDAIVNYLSLLGWNSRSGRDIFTFQELKDEFSLLRLNKAPAVFDKEKLLWYNNRYLRGGGVSYSQQLMYWVVRRLFKLGVFGENQQKDVDSSVGGCEAEAAHTHASLASVEQQEKDSLDERESESVSSFGEVKSLDCLSSGGKSFESHPPGGGICANTLKVKRDACESPPPQTPHQEKYNLSHLLPPLSASRTPQEKYTPSNPPLPSTTSRTPPLHHALSWAISPQEAVERLKIWGAHNPRIIEFLQVVMEAFESSIATASDFVNKMSSVVFKYPLMESIEELKNPSNCKASHSPQIEDLYALRRILIEDCFNTQQREPGCTYREGIFMGNPFSKLPEIALKESLFEEEWRKWLADLSSKLGGGVRTAYKKLLPMLRIALTGRAEGIEVKKQVRMMLLAEFAAMERCFTLQKRMEVLRDLEDVGKT